MAEMIFIRPLQFGHSSTISGRSNLANTVEIGAECRAEDSPMHSARFLMHSARFLLIAAFGTGIASAQTCDRACLKTTLDQYLNAVVKHDTSAAPLFVGFRQTDNGVVVRPGTGTWQSVTALGDIQRKFFDPVSGQAAYLGLIKEGQATDIATLRLRVENRQITEAEWVIARQGAMGPSGTAGGNLYNLAGFIAEPPPDRTVPQNQRVSREVLIAIANSYFCLLYTSDAADERSSVDLGGRRIIKKK